MRAQLVGSLLQGEWRKLIDESSEKVGIWHAFEAAIDWENLRISVTPNTDSAGEGWESVVSER